MKFWMDEIEYFIAGYAIVLSINIYESVVINFVCACVYFNLFLKFFFFVSSSSSCEMIQKRFFEHLVAVFTFYFLLFLICVYQVILINQSIETCH